MVGSYSSVNDHHLVVRMYTADLHCVCIKHIISMKGYKCTIFQNIFAILVMVGLRWVLNRPLENSFEKLHFGGLKCSMYEDSMRPRSSTKYFHVFLFLWISAPLSPTKIHHCYLCKL